MSLIDALKSPAARVPRPARVEPAVRDLPDPDAVTIPLEYPGPQLLSPLVQAGDTVSRGQPVGRADSGLCVHASVGGEVEGIVRIWSAGGRQVPAVSIRRGDAPALEPDALLSAAGVDPATATRVQRLLACGVVTPWSDGAHAEVERLVVLGHDEEPTQHVQEILLQTRAEELARGFALLRDVAPRAELALTVPKRLAGWAREAFPGDVELLPVPDDYRRRLVRRVAPPGAATLTAESALAAQDALEGRPRLHKVLSVSGDGLDAPLTVRVPLGADARSILDACGLDAAGSARLLAGGPLAGTALYTDRTPIDALQHGLHLLDGDRLPEQRNRTCVSCGRCTAACPADLQVHLIGRCIEFDQFDEAAALQPEACWECSLCAFVCPARRPLVQLVRLARTSRRISL